LPRRAEESIATYGAQEIDVDCQEEYMLGISYMPQLAPTAMAVGTAGG